MDWSQPELIMAVCDSPQVRLTRSASGGSFQIHFSP